MLNKDNQKKVGLYVHIPFCFQKCRYCDFNSHIGKGDEIKDYINALIKEIKKVGNKSIILDSIFFGGGTPTMLNKTDLCRILNVIKQTFDVDKDAEVTTECNPGTIDKAGLAYLYRNGFNRLSVGMQSADDEQLKILGRIHTFDDCKKCVKDAKDIGFENISIDLMFGLPNQSLISWRDSILQGLSLEISHISAYALKIEEGTPFYKNGIKSADEDLSRDMYDLCTEVLNKNGFERYEISNFAKEGKQSRHNLKYWQTKDYIGVGAGASSYFLGKRYLNIANTERYIDLMNTNQNVITHEEVLTEADKMSEFIYLGLRLKDGFSLNEFKTRFNRSVEEVFKYEIDKNLKRGTLKMQNDRIYIPKEYTYVSNQIMSEFV